MAGTIQILSSGKKKFMQKYFIVPAIQHGRHANPLYRKKFKLYTQPHKNDNGKHLRNWNEWLQKFQKSIDMQVPKFVNVVAASCLLRCCGVYFIYLFIFCSSWAWRSLICSSVITAIFFLSRILRMRKVSHCPSTDQAGHCYAFKRLYLSARTSFTRAPTRSGLATPKMYGTGVSINFGPPCLHDKK